jgi:REP element-mobilizing transposase RayT
MPRLPRVHLEKALYFVTCKSGYGQQLFHDKADYDAYQAILAHYKKEDGFKVFAFVLMPAYLHLFIEPTTEATISVIMHDLNSNYTKYYNGRYNKNGHLFQGRFKNIIVEKEGHLLDITRYIHLCPEKDGVCEDARFYAHSSYGKYLALPDQAGLEMSTEVQEAISYLGKNGGVEEYREFIGRIDDASFGDLRKLLQSKPYLGSKEFIDLVRKKMEEACAAAQEDKAPQPFIEEIVIRKTNPVFLAVGSLIVLILAFVAFDFYKINTGLRATYDTTTQTYAQQVTTMQKTISDAKAKNDGLHEIERFAWEIKLMPVGETLNGEQNDMLRFVDGRLFSDYLSANGYAPFEYQFVSKTDGTVVWQTSQTNPAGTRMSWYGVWNGKMIRGVLSERPVQGTNRDFSFISVGRIQNGA